MCVCFILYINEHCIIIEDKKKKLFKNNVFQKFHNAHTGYICNLILVIEEKTNVSCCCELIVRNT